MNALVNAVELVELFANNVAYQSRLEDRLDRKK